MQQIIRFLLQNKHFLFFLLLLSLGLGLTIQSHLYHKSKFIHAANNVTGGMYESANQFNEYFNLKTYNERLLNENARLRKEISNFKINESRSYPTTESFDIIPAKLVENSFNKKKNILVINRGSNHGVAPDMGVITTNGIVGIIDKVGNNFATVISVLHTESRISAELKKTSQLGSLFWNGNEKNIVQLEDISTISSVKKGDTIVTGNYSTFPQGIGIGTIKQASLNQSKNYYDIDINLFNDMSSIGYVYVIKNNSKKEINQLTNNNTNE